MTTGRKRTQWPHQKAEHSGVRVGCTRIDLDDGEGQCCEPDHKGDRRRPESNPTPYDLDHREDQQREHDETGHVRRLAGDQPGKCGLAGMVVRDHEADRPERDRMEQHVSRNASRAHPYEIWIVAEPEDNRSHLKLSLRPVAAVGTANTMLPRFAPFGATSPSGACAPTDASSSV